MESSKIPDLYETLVANSFQMEQFECAICMDDRSGLECHKMSNCGCVFCTDCLSGYFESKIQDGDTSFTCPNPTCGETISQRDIQIHVERDKFNRFERLQFNRALDTMDDIAYCPKPNCRTPTVKMNRESTNVRCAQCTFNYCTECEKEAHEGECKHTDEEMESAAQELNRYGFTLTGSNNHWKYRFRARQARDENKIQQIGRRFGGVQKIDDYIAAQQRKRDNEASVAHLRASSKTCPGCNRWVQRTAGCDHMTCTTSHCKVCFTYHHHN